MKPGVYRHFKGRYYLVIGVAQHSETGESLVVYKPLYEHDGAEYAVRPVAMFEEHVNGAPRFAYVGEVGSARV